MFANAMVLEIISSCEGHLASRFDTSVAFLTCVSEHVSTEV